MRGATASRKGKAPPWVQARICASTARADLAFAARAWPGRRRFEETLHPAPGFTHHGRGNRGPRMRGAPGSRCRCRHRAEIEFHALSRRCPDPGSGNHGRRGRRMAGTPQGLRAAGQPAVPDRGRPHQAEAAASSDPAMSGWRLRGRLRCRHVPSRHEDDRQPAQDISERLDPASAAQAAHVRAPPGFRFTVNRRLRVPQRSSCRTPPCFLRSRHRRGRQWPRLNPRPAASRCFGPRRH